MSEGLVQWQNITHILVSLFFSEEKCEKIMLCEKKINLEGKIIWNFQNHILVMLIGC